MSRGLEPGSGAEIVRALLSVLEPALTRGAPDLTVTAAREVAQLLGLDGLDQVLERRGRQGDRPWPATLEAIAGRLREAGARARSEGSIRAFEEIDPDLAAQARDLDKAAVSSATTEPAGSLTVAEALGDLPLSGAHARDEARRVRLTTRVATALRAALDWLSPGSSVKRPLRLIVEESVLELGIDQVDPAGLAAAGEVLASAGGNLGPGLKREGAEGSSGWRLRVPAAVARPFFLMVRQGGLGLALPWHAVLRLRMQTGESGEEGLASRLGAPTLESLVTGAPRAAAHPFTLVAHGLRRAWLPVDEVVWRLPAEACEPETRAPVEGLSGTVRTDDGESFWVVEPGWLLRGVSVPSLPQRHPLSPKPSRAPGPAPAPRPPAPAIRMLRSEDVEPLAYARARATETRPEAEAPEVEAPARASAPTAPSPIPAPPSAHAAETAPAVAHAAETAPEAEPAPEPARTALVAEDSITAGVFLARLLEQRGFQVQVVARAHELRAAMAAGSWTLVCADIDLPDERGPALLRQLAERRIASGYSLVALVRDASDAAIAGRAGVSIWLRKPFEPEAIDRALERAGLAPRGPR